MERIHSAIIAQIFPLIDGVGIQGPAAEHTRLSIEDEYGGIACFDTQQARDLNRHIERLALRIFFQFYPHEFVRRRRRKMAAHPHLRDQIAVVGAIWGLRRGDQIARQRHLDLVQRGVRGHECGLPLLGDLPALGDQLIDVVTVDLQHVLRRGASGFEPGTLIFREIVLRESLIHLKNELQLIQQLEPHVSVGIVKDNGQRIRKV